jgi:hypothetical protein
MYPDDFKEYKRGCRDAHRKKHRSIACQREHAIDGRKYRQEVDSTPRSDSICFVEFVDPISVKVLIWAQNRFGWEGVD